MSPSTVRPFVGRERERQLLNGLVNGMPSGGGALVVLGEPGVGKTALLEQLALTAAAARQIWIRGVESEAVLAFAAAADLLLPLHRYFDQLPNIQRECLEISLALRAGAIPSPLAGCAAALNVLSAAGEEQPLLVLIDDFQWVDSPSQQIMLFVARRLASERVAMILTLRELPGSYPMVLGLPTLQLSGLSMEECRQLINALRVEISERVLTKIVEQTGGNPLAVLETIASAPSEVLRGSGADSISPSLGPSLEQAWSLTFDTLPEPTRVALLVLAAIQSAELSTIAPVLEALGLSLTDLAPAERARLVQAAGAEFSLRHPLLRSVILNQTPLATRLSVYRILADHSVGHLRAWYMAASVAGPDDAVADELATAAVAARDRSGYQASGSTWRRAAELTVEPGRRAERLLAAATDAHLAGEWGLAHAWCEEALALRRDPSFVADVEVVRGRATIWLGHPLRAAADLVRAGDAVLEQDAQRAAHLYAEAVMPYAMANRVHDMLAVALQSAAAEPSGHRSLRTVSMLATALVLTGGCQEARDRLDLGERLAANADPVLDLYFITMLAYSHVWLEDFEASRTLLGSALNGARRSGASSILTLALGVRCELDWWTGHWAAAYADATEALHWAQELNQAASLGLALTALARFDAARGDLATCWRRLDQAQEAVGEYGIDCMQGYIPSASGFAALATGDLDAATQYLDAIWAAVRTGGMEATNVVPFAGDLVEAHIRAGNHARAEEALGWLNERAVTSGLVYPASTAARCRGMLAEDLDTAERCFAEAKALHDRRPMPFERARTLLCEAETLRRLRRPAAARPLLREALSVFNGLQARPWAVRAESELAATGARVTPDRRQRGLDILTPQEFQIARAVADGLNNAEAAAMLFISRKTVEAHLTRVYRKLGVRSRTELALLFPSMSPS